MKRSSLRNFLRRAAALTLSAVLALPMTVQAAAPTPLLSSRQTYLDGVSYVHTVSDTASGRIESYAVELPRNSTVEPILLQSSGTIYGGASVSKAIELAESQGYNVYAAINTDYFSTSTGIPLGIVIEDGVYKSDAAGAPAMVIGPGGTSLCATPEISLTLTNYATGETVTPNHFNKLRVSTGGMYLLNGDFSTVSTRTSTPGWFVRMKQTSPIPQTLGVNSTLQLQVTEVLLSSDALTIGEGEYILTADDGANLSAVFESFHVGDMVALETRCTDPALSAAKWAGGTGDKLVDNGMVTDKSGWLYADTGRAPRSAIGMRADGTLILYAVDGRQSGYSAGLTLQDLAEEMVRLGCRWAVNLDGGGSTALSVRTPGETTPAIKNSPSDGKARACATFLLLVSRQQGTGWPSALSLTGNEIVVLTGSSVALPDAVMTDNALTPLATDQNDIRIQSRTGLGHVVGNLYTAGTTAGTDTLALRSSRYGVSGTAEVQVVDKLTELNVHLGGSSANLASLSVNPGDMMQLTVTGSYLGREVLSGPSGVTFAVSEGLGSVDENGMFTVSPTASGEGTLTVSAGGLSKTVKVKLLNLHLDVMSDHWAHDAVDFCYRNGIVNGISATEFGPDNLIRRGDFILMLYSALGRPAVTSPCTFTDVSPSDYYYTALSWAQETGLMGGVGDGRCLPLDPITREQAFTVLWKALPLLDLDCPDAPAGMLSRFKDASLIADYARIPTATLVAQGIVGGNGDGINPQGRLTRAEMATLVYKVMNHTPVTEYPDVPDLPDVPETEGGTTAPAAGDLSLDFSELTLWSGETYRLTLSGANGAEVVWSSSDPTVAAVASDGTVTNLYTGMGTETAIITATCGGKSVSCTVSCPQAGLVGIIYNVAHGLNIRSAPDRSATVQGMLNAGDVVVVLDHKDGWYKILYHDATQARTGYVSADYVVLNMR